MQQRQVQHVKTKPALLGGCTAAASTWEHLLLAKMPILSLAI
jgi:hypothetical protein